MTVAENGKTELNVYMVDVWLSKHKFPINIDSFIILWHNIP